MLSKFSMAILAMAAFSCSHAGAGEQRARTEATPLTNQEAWQIYEKYLLGWNATSEQQQAKLAAEVVAENVAYSTPRHESGGRTTIIEDMAAFQKKYPGGHFEVGDVSAHHHYALLTWVMFKPDGTELARGHDEIRIAADRKIVSVITFAPAVLKP